MQQMTIKQYLKEKKITQKELAKELNISDTAICKLKTGELQISKKMEERLIDYFEKQNISIMIPKTSLENTRWRRKYDNLSKSYEELLKENLELKEEIKTFKYAINYIIKASNNLREIAIKRKIKIRQLEVE